MFYTEKQVQRMIGERLDQVQKEEYYRRRFEEFEGWIGKLEKRICELEYQMGKYNEARTPVVCNTADRP